MNKILIRLGILILAIIPAYISSFLTQKLLVGYALKDNPPCYMDAPGGSFIIGPCADKTGGVQFTLAFPIFLVIFYFLILLAKNKFLK